MMNFLRPRQMDKEELNDFLKVLIRQLVKDKPELAKNRKMLADVVEATANLVEFKFKNNREALTREKLCDRDALKQIALCMMISAVLTEDKALCKELDNTLTKLLKNDKFMTEFKKLIDPKKGPKLSAKELHKEIEKLLDKHLHPGAKQELKKALKEVTDKLFGKIDKEFNKAFKVAPTGGDSLTPFTGLINSLVAGSEQATIVSSPLDYTGGPELNPNYETSSDNLSKKNSVSKTQFGDSAGTTHHIEQNYAKIGDTLTDSLLDSLNDAGLTPSTAPRPKGPTTIPGG